jgi:enoyl-CoA hydratase/carnithine racemase
VGELTAREMLLSAAILDAPEMKRRGFLNQVVGGRELDNVVRSYVERIRPLAPQAARLNKQTFRAMALVKYSDDATELIANAYRYASSSEHREGVTAFVEKRPARFEPDGQR